MPFYVKVPKQWNKRNIYKFKEFLVDKVGNYYRDSITECRIVHKKKLYGFDAEKNINLCLLNLKI